MSTRPAIYNLRAFQAGLLVARCLPRPWTQALAKPLGRAVFARNSAGQAALRENLRVLTGIDGAALDALCAENVTQFSRMLADYFFCASRGEAAVRALVDEWHGLEQLEAARAHGKGVILITAHLGHWELGGLLLAGRGFPVTVITLDEPTTALTEWRDRYRRTLGIKTIAVGPGREFAFVEMIATLRRNECLAMLVDRPPAGTGAPVLFAGQTTEFSSGPALLWQHTGAAVVPAFVVRNARGCYTSLAEPAVPMAARSDRAESIAVNTQTIASVFESIIRKHPEQWFNYVPIWPSSSFSS